MILCNLPVEAGEKMPSQLVQPLPDVRPHRRKQKSPLRCAMSIAFLALLLTSWAQAASPLNGIHKIQVASMGDGASSQALRQRIVDRLRKSGRLQVVESQTDADVALRGTSNMWATGTISLSPHSKSATQTIYEGYLSVELANKDGQTLWSYLATPSHFRTAGITDDLADQIVSRLLAAIQGGAAGSISPSAAPGTHVALHAAGSTLAAPLYRKWFQSSGISVDYDAIGSEEGIKRLANGAVDFAGSDMPLSAGNTRNGLSVIQIPTVVGGVVPIYNLPGLGRPLRLTPQTLAGIYSGAIRKWNDPRILESNRGAHLPDADIMVVHRSDGSGTTYVWTSFLSLASPEWKASIGSGARVDWPVGNGVPGNDGVADTIQKTPHAIGYVELIYAIQHELNYAAVRNPAGEFIKADLASIFAAAMGATAEKAQDLHLSILDAPGNDAYPISTFTWLLVPVRGVSPEKKSTIADLLDWALTSGQKQCASLGYAPLPRQVVAGELRAVDAWKGKD
jgi:phosphate ABC transporter phosphate-binding protein